MARSGRSSKELKRTYEFILGYDACAIAVCRHRNPYPSSTKEFDEWRNGWNKRFWGEEMYSDDP